MTITQSLSQILLVLNKHLCNWKALWSKVMLTSCIS